MTHDETGNETQALEVRVKFFCPLGAGGIRALGDEIAACISSIKKVGFRLHEDPKRRHHWTLDFDYYNLTFSEADAKVREAMSAVEAYCIEDSQLTFVNLPILKRPRKPQAPFKACHCEDFPCKHIPKLSESEQLAKWKHEDAAERQRRQQRDRRQARLGRDPMK